MHQSVIHGVPLEYAGTLTFNIRTAAQTTRLAAAVQEGNPKQQNWYSKYAARLWFCDMVAGRALKSFQPGYGSVTCLQVVP